MADLLTAIRTVKFSDFEHDKPLLVPVATAVKTRETPTSLDTVISPEAALKALQSRPHLDELQRTLTYLLCDRSSEFHVHSPSPISARIVHELVNTTIFNYNAPDGPERPNLLQCLQSVHGISAIVVKLRRLAAEARATAGSHDIEMLLSILSDILSGDLLVSLLWSQIQHSQPTQKALLQKELITLIASGKIVSAAAHALTKCAQGPTMKATWLATGADYSAWLGRNLFSLITRPVCDVQDVQQMVSALFSRALAFGYPHQIVNALFDLALARQVAPNLEAIASFHLQLRGRDHVRFLDLTLRYCSQHFDLANVSLHTKASEPLKRACSFLTSVVADSNSMRDCLSEWASDPSRNCTEPIAARRTALFVLRADAVSLRAVMAANMQLFGDSLFINHAPLVQQEACAQSLLIAAAFLQKTDSAFVLAQTRSSLHTNATSKRLNASSVQARILGMVISMALSRLVDGPEQRMDFKVDEVQTVKARAYIDMIYLSPDLKLLPDLELLASQALLPDQPSKETIISTAKRKSFDTVKKPSNRLPQRSSDAVNNGPRIIEVFDDDDVKDDLVPYPKPDSDPDDEDEDPTLINRDKPRAPVYIRDLIKGLQDTDNYDCHSLALATAGPLIRRKARFGKEVTDHVYELRAILAGLSDNFDMPHFAEMRLQALIALLIADPKEVAPSYARQVFEGDYSMSQRATLLSALGLSARELAGFGDSDELNQLASATMFPSKQLPDRLHKVYAPMQAITDELEQAMIQPMARQAVDAASGPNALKTRTFSTRMDVEKKRTKVIPNILAKTMAEYFFAPLTGHWWAQARAYRSKSNVHHHPFLLSTFLKTLAIMLHASGSGTLSLPAMTTEFWDLLLEVRARAAEHVSVMEAVLFGLLTLLEVNEDKRRLAEEHSRQLVETQEWAAMVQERLGGNGTSGISSDDENHKVRMLAIGVLVHTQEVVDKYQKVTGGRHAELLICK